MVRNEILSWNRPQLQTMRFDLTLTPLPTPPPLPILSRAEPDEPASKEPYIWADRFEVLAPLGKGGAGVVMHAKDLAEGGREVALKILRKPEVTFSRRVRLEREGQVTASLDHPAFLEVYGSGSHQGRPYLILELVQGAHTMREVFDTARLRRRLELIRDTARALGYAHERGIVHRDVKPENLLVDRSGQVRVADLGLARAPEAMQLTAEGSTVGTMAYMSPEQALGERDRIGPETDVWSLGVVLYEALTDEHPFLLGDELRELLAAVVSGKVRPPRELQPELPSELEAIALKALAHSPEERYRNGESLARALDRYLSPAPPSPRGRRRASEAWRKRVRPRRESLKARLWAWLTHSTQSAGRTASGSWDSQSPPTPA